MGERELKDAERFGIPIQEPPEGSHPDYGLYRMVDCETGDGWVCATKAFAKMRQLEAQNRALADQCLGLSDDVAKLKAERDEAVVRVRFFESSGATPECPECGGDADDPSWTECTYEKCPLHCAAKQQGGGDAD